NNRTITNISISFNGGKDCLVLLILYLAVIYDTIISVNKRGYNSNNNNHLEAIDSVYINYEETFPELESFIKETETKYNLQSEKFDKIQLKEGFENYLKLKPNKNYILIGIRRSDFRAETSQNLEFIQRTDNNWPEFNKVSPLLNWNNTDIWMFLLSLDIKYCELYNNGFTSLGGTNSTVPNPVLEKSSFESWPP
ncbi:Phosphoadenosine phosphosulfate reductase, partial [Ascoidea rubescens DSM 1968]